jgi:hypothetical protein
LISHDEEILVLFGEKTPFQAVFLPDTPETIKTMGIIPESQASVSR